MRIVLDTNVLVSGLLHSEGNPGRVVALTLAGAVQVCHDPRILAEYAEVLARPRFKFDPARTRHVLAKLDQDGVPVQPGGEPVRLPDADDEPFLAVALAALADYLVTGNLKDYPRAERRGCAVVSPAEFMRIWSQLHPEPPQSPE
jgi:putative PIN family toxin of toxin-antitoxin system